MTEYLSDIDQAYLVALYDAPKIEVHFADEDKMRQMGYITENNTLTHHGIAWVVGLSAPERAFYNWISRLSYEVQPRSERKGGMLYYRLVSLEPHLREYYEPLEQKTGVKFTEYTALASTYGSISQCIAIIPDIREDTDLNTWKPIK